MGRSDRGSASLTTVLLTPIFVVLAFSAFQAAMFTHARTEARAVARDAAVLVARQGNDRAAVESSARGALAGHDSLADTQLDISVDAGNELVTVTVTGRAPGIIRGTSLGIDITEVLPVERFRP